MLPNAEEILSSVMVFPSWSFSSPEIPVEAGIIGNISFDGAGVQFSVVELIESASRDGDPGDGSELIQRLEATKAACEAALLSIRQPPP